MKTEVATPPTPASLASRSLGRLRLLLERQQAPQPGRREEKELTLQDVMSQKFGFEVPPEAEAKANPLDIAEQDVDEACV
jgi:hypothetical protein